LSIISCGIILFSSLGGDGGGSVLGEFWDRVCVEVGDIFWIWALALPFGFGFVTVVFLRFAGRFFFFDISFYRVIYRFGEFQMIIFFAKLVDLEKYIQQTRKLEGKR